MLSAMAGVGAFLMLATAGFALGRLLMLARVREALGSVLMLEGAAVVPGAIAAGAAADVAGSVGSGRLGRSASLGGGAAASSLGATGT